MSEDALIVITSAIKTAFIDHPGSGHGTTWDQVTKSDEESIHLAKAVLVALRKAGYSVTKVEDQNAPKPKRREAPADVIGDAICRCRNFPDKSASGLCWRACRCGLLEGARTSNWIIVIIATITKCEWPL